MYGIAAVPVDYELSSGKTVTVTADRVEVNIDGCVLDGNSLEEGIEM